MEELIINKLKELCNQALLENEVPIAAIVVEDNKIIGEGYNKIEQTNNFMNHAEVIAIEQAIKNKGNWRLNNCILYSSLEPCNMCKEIIRKSRISKVIYFSSKNENETEKEPSYYEYNNSYFSNLLTNFFKNKR